MSIAACGLSLVRRMGLPSQVAHVGFIAASFSCCRAGWALGHGASVVAVRACLLHTRDPTRDPCIGRQMLSHWTTREGPLLNAFTQRIRHRLICLWLLCRNALREEEELEKPEVRRQGTGRSDGSLGEVA